MFQPFTQQLPSGRSMQLPAASPDAVQPGSAARVNSIAPVSVQLDLGTLDNSDLGVDFWLYTPYYTRVERATLVGYPAFSAPDVRVQFIQKTQDGVVELGPQDQLESLSTDPFQLTPPGSLGVLPLYLRVRGPQASGKTALLTLHVINSENR